MLQRMSRFLAQRVRYCAAMLRQLLGVDRTHWEVTLRRLRLEFPCVRVGPTHELMAQYSPASMMVMTRLVTSASDGSRECKVSVGSK